MAIAAANASYSGTGPTADLQVVMQSGHGGPLAKMLVCTATWSGDGTATTTKLNYIDGTKKLWFTPVGILANRSGGGATGTIDIVSIVDDGNQQTASVTFSAAPGAAATVTGTIVIFG